MKIMKQSAIFLIIILTFVLLSLEIYVIYYIPESYLVYKDKSTYQYYNSTLELPFNESMEPYSVCTQTLPPVCYWYNVPPSKDKTYIHTANPTIAFLIDYQNYFILLFIPIIVIQLYYIAKKRGILK